MAQSKFWENLNKLESIAEESKIYSPIDVYAKTVASTPEIAGEVSKEVKEDLNTLDLTTADITIKNNLAAELIASNLSERNDYTGAVKAFFYSEKGLSLANMNGWQNTEDSFFGKLYNPDIGDERLDEQTFSMIGKYAAYAYKQGVGAFGAFKGLGGHEADGVVTEKEIIDVVNAMERNIDLKKAYESGNNTTYFAELEKTLIKVLGTITLQENQFFSPKVMIQYGLPIFAGNANFMYDCSSLKTSVYKLSDSLKVFSIFSSSGVKLL